ncbi:NAD(P)-dependent oxidoreductase [Brachybacterium sp. Z12]|uniref:NAD-dependent epimerase/dehydratase family protein n=1 Tax=Brachybacterium sp. Z12 TaxID=2759167 RepID=UPI00223AF4A4|nr:NAD-dependent epimerase/dehydratase family protein [Brachybacterium sp. Z12]
MSTVITASTMPAHAPADEAELDELLSRPLPGVGEALAALEGDIVLLGAGGKIGPTMSLMARRALDEVGSDTRVIAVSRFSDPASRTLLEDAGIVVHPADLSRSESYADLPDAAGMFYLAAMKFGTSGQEHQTWWSNAAMPALVADRYRGVPSLVYSTGNVYPLTPLGRGGSTEAEEPAPVGEYAQSCLARERLFSYASHTWGTPVSIYRLNYACELRYGVIADIATKIAAGEEVDVTMPAVNVAWQGDINAWALRSIELAGTPRGSSMPPGRRRSPCADSPSGWARRWASSRSSSARSPPMPSSTTPPTSMSSTATPRCRCAAWCAGWDSGSPAVAVSSARPPSSSSGKASSDD